MSGEAGRSGDCEAGAPSKLGMGDLDKDGAAPDTTKGSVENWWPREGGTPEVGDAIP